MVKDVRYIEKESCAVSERKSYEDALDLTDFGIYNAIMLVSCNLLILAMYLDIFGFSVAMPAVACDMDLTIKQQGLLTAIPLIGVMISSYAWGLFADTLGRRLTLLLAMPIGAVLNLVASLAPTYASLAALKFFSAGFTSSANAAAYVLLGETTPQRHRSQFLFLMASVTMLSQCVISLVALPVFELSFDIYISWLSLRFRPWRLLMLIISLPGVLGVFGMIFLHESPKFLLSKHREYEALEILKKMYSLNTLKKRDKLSVKTIFLQEPVVIVHSEKSFLCKVWSQTAPLFKPPLLKNSLKLYYILLSAYMTSTGYTMWVPTMTNAYFNDDENSNKTFCEVASSLASTITESGDCNNTVRPLTLYAVICYSGASGLLSIFFSFLVTVVEKKTIALLVFLMSVICGLALIFIRIPLFSLILFFLFNYVALILGTINTYLVELNPTHLRGMATCLSVVIARGFGFVSVQLIGSLLESNCVPMLIGYVVFEISGLVLTFFLPDTGNNKKEENFETTNNRC